MPAFLALTLAAGASGCAGGPPTVDPGGVDGLTVPTPSPRAADFVDGIDNPWLPLVPGTVRTYRSDTAAGSATTTTVTVTDEARIVAGVTTTVVHDVVTDARGRTVEDTYAWFAQDRDGNVWSFGEDASTSAAGGADGGSWEAGVDGAEAGLAMPADPRVGDGYARGRRAGVVEDRVEVLALDETTRVAAGTFAGLLRTEETSPLEPGTTREVFYAEGLGMVLEETEGVVEERLELVEVTER